MASTGSCDDAISSIARDLKIVVAGHKSYWMPSEECYLPVQAGSAGQQSISGFQRDDQGDNISEKNSSFCELTALYWAWKNLDCEWLGLAHYRRYFATGLAGEKHGRIATNVDIAKGLAKSLIVLPKPRNYVIETNWSQYVHAHNEQDLITMRDILCESQPIYVEKYDEVMARTWGHRFNMFCMHRSIADAWCTWLFDVLFELEKRLDLSDYSPNDRRVFGFVAERLLDVWIETNGLDYVEMPVVNLENQHWLRKGAAFLGRKMSATRTTLASCVVNSKKKELSTKPPGDLESQRKASGMATFELLKQSSGDNTFMLTDEQVKSTQQVVWEIAQDIIDVCEQNDIRYFMDGGTCLGAIRHEGFIPWDDDIDIAIPRADYDCFLEAFKKRHGKDYWVHSPVITADYCLPHAQIRRKGTLFKGRDDVSESENGVPVDIFVVENVFGNPIARIAQGILCDFSLLLLSCRKFAAFTDHYLWFVEGIEAAEKSVRRKATIGRLASFIPLDATVRFANWTSRLCKDNSSTWVSIPSGWEHFFGGLNRRDMLFPTTTANFEGREVSIPARFSDYMIGLYGENYMELPPEEKRERHVLSHFNLDAHKEGKSS